MEILHLTPRILIQKDQENHGSVWFGVARLIHIPSLYKCVVLIMEVIPRTQFLKLCNPLGVEGR